MKPEPRSIVHAGAGLLALILAACQAPMAVPEKLAPPPTETLTMVIASKGVQIYECRARRDRYGFGWAFVAPGAELAGSHGRVVGQHGEGPFWKASDGSKTVGTTKERSDAPVAGAIPWLLLTAKSAGPDGMFSKVTSVQRVNTAGGVAPAD